MSDGRMQRPDLAPTLTGDLQTSTVIPPGQRSSQELRGWFRAQVGPSFRFDRHMREFIRSADGMTTLGDAVKHWEATRCESVSVIDRQFEFNRITRTWYGNNPAGTSAQLSADWQHYS